MYFDHGKRVHQFRAKSDVRDRVADWQKTPIGLLLTAVGAMKFGFGALLLVGLLVVTLATTLRLLAICIGCFWDHHFSS